LEKEIVVDQRLAQIHQYSEPRLKRPLVGILEKIESNNIFRTVFKCRYIHLPIVTDISPKAEEEHQYSGTSHAEMRLGLLILNLGSINRGCSKEDNQGDIRDRINHLRL
jgi:hypothetical protein